MLKLKKHPEDIFHIFFPLDLTFRSFIQIKVKLSKLFQNFVDKTNIALKNDDNFLI